MKPYNIDVPVLLIFFARPEQFKKVFDEVRKARPSKLYLYQDGARPNREDDIVNIQKCREIAENIDWECQVFRKYQEQNFGCDPSEYISQKWMFDSEEYGIVLEDDDVPSQSFFPFCKELLEKYKDDERIGIICGMNNLEEVKMEESYFFSNSGSIWGWAGWKRNIDKWDGNYSWLDDISALQKLKNSMEDWEFEMLVNSAKKHRETGREHYESILAASLFLNNQVNIIPKINMISNIGIGANGTHAAASLDTIPKKVRKLLYMETHDIAFPLIHPKYIVNNLDYKNKINRTLGNTSRFIKIGLRIESLYLRILHGDMNYKKFIKILRRKK